VQNRLPKRTSDLPEAEFRHLLYGDSFPNKILMRLKLTGPKVQTLPNSHDEPALPKMRCSESVTSSLRAAWSTSHLLLSWKSIPRASRGALVIHKYAKYTFQRCISPLPHRKMRQPKAGDYDKNASNRRAKHHLSLPNQQISQVGALLRSDL
jgi:hypothetical protein